MSDRSGIFAGDDPFKLAQAWLKEAEASEPNDPNAIALSTVDAEGMPNARMVLLKDIEAAGNKTGAFVFYTNYDSAKGTEIAATGKAAFVCLDRGTLFSIESPARSKLWENLSVVRLSWMPGVLDIMFSALPS